MLDADVLCDSIKKAKEYNMVCYIDAVLNHKGGADEAETFLAKEVDQADLNNELTDAYVTLSLYIQRDLTWSAL